MTRISFNDDPPRSRGVYMRSKYNFLKCPFKWMPQLRLQQEIIPRRGPHLRRPGDSVVYLVIHAGPELLDSGNSLGVFREKGHLNSQTVEPMPVGQRRLVSVNREDALRLQVRWVSHALGVGISERVGGRASWP